ncbi:MAG TPA: hypothetical protein VGQ83_24690 [Polyangia bacterium]|jgi:hypothetical protein
MRLRRPARLVRPALLALALGCGATAAAGPPYVTDDPEPVEHRHWELYLASQHARDRDDWSGTAPHLEVNYGVVPAVQLHVIAPLVYDAPRGAGARYGYGDTELGVKVRFVDERGWRPMIGVFPLLELPTGSAARGLGSGHVQGYLPLWLQKSFGPWSTYGGAGYWITAGAGNRSYWYCGWQVQRKLGPVAVGAELFHTTPRTTDAGHETRFNLGAVVDLTATHHLLFSAGRGLQGPNELQAYAAYQLTFGPAEPHPGAGHPASQPER